MKSNDRLHLPKSIFVEVLPTPSRVSFCDRMNASLMMFERAETGSVAHVQNLSRRR
jgi:hypothetical protein